MSRAQDIWRPGSWRTFLTRHQPHFDDRDALAQALATIHSLPPLVHPDDVDRLRLRLAQASINNAFVLQAGHCAELFTDCAADKVASQVSLISEMANWLSRRTGKPTIKIGRIAGQFAKPRSRQTEIINGQEVISFLGDNVNGYALDKRQPDPRRLVQGYFHAKAALKYLSRHGSAQDFFTSHEGLLLPLEESQTHYVDNRQAWYNLSAHMLWIGERTRGIDEGHVEYFRGIANPIGIKIGPDVKPDSIVDLVLRLNPENHAGKIALITRYGAAEIQKITDLLAAVLKARLQVVWLCDPMHGNTTVLPSGLKTRALKDIIGEIDDVFRLHSERGHLLSGLHLEVASEPVTECLGGPNNITPDQLEINYQSKCDPRLNPLQAFDVIERFARLAHVKSISHNWNKAHCLWDHGLALDRMAGP